MSRRILHGDLVTVAALGLVALGIILTELVQSGISAINPQVFTEVTPPPDGPGGLINAIYGSLLMTGMAVVVATPCTVCVETLAPETGPETEFADRRASPFGLVTISSSTLSAPELPFAGSGTGCAPPSRTLIVSTELWLPFEPEK